MKTKEVYFLLLVYCVFFLIFIWACFLELCFALVVGGILLIAGGISRLFWFVTSCQMHGRWQRWWPWCRSGMLVGCASLRWISWLRCWCVCFKNPLPISNMLPSMIELPPCPTMVLLSQDHSHRIRGRCLVPWPGNVVPIRGSGSKRVSVSFKVGSRPGLRGVAAPLLEDLIGIRRLLIEDWDGFC